ncbi:MgtC/SapB family protein [Xanthobacter sp. TB0136]|uniref:MgtC/SapB family protein n=1 Tax=Xanthobacter sp. TB0136 TaxID=3459177 RepID=UPI0040390B8C
MDHLIFRLAVSLAIGLLVGLERGWREREEPAGSRTAGIRTYALCGLLGGVSAELTRELDSPVFLVTTGIVYAAIFAIFKYREMVQDHDYSITSLIAALLVFALGALAVLGETAIAGAAAIATTGLLAARDRLHGMVHNMTWPELRSALLLLGMTVIVLPLLPNHTIDPYNSINPRQIWLFMVLTASISFAGYVAVKVVGPDKGIFFSAIGGALVSSTAVTIAFARRSALGEVPGLLAGGAALAAMVSLLRVMIICAIVAPALLEPLLPPALVASVVFCVGGIWLMRHGTQAPCESCVGNPFEFGPLLAFAGMFGIVSAFSGFLLYKVGPQSLYLVSAVAGIVDVDVPALNAARLAGGSLSLESAAQCILIAIGMNALGRVGFAAAAGTFAFSIRLAVITAGAILAGLATALALHEL